MHPEWLEGLASFLSRHPERADRQQTYGLLRNDPLDLWALARAGAPVIDPNQFWVHRAGDERDRYDWDDLSLGDYLRALRSLHVRLNRAVVSGWTLHTHLDDGFVMAAPTDGRPVRAFCDDWRPQR